jgi:hypothetical protein
MNEWDAERQSTKTAWFTSNVHVGSERAVRVYDDDNSDELQQSFGIRN